MPRRRSKEEIEQRVLEAEKIVVSNMLYRWKRDWGMDYVIVVRNNERSTFSRSSVSREGKEDILSAIERVRDRIDPMESWVVRPMEEPEDDTEENDAPEDGSIVVNGVRLGVGYRYRLQFAEDGEPLDVEITSIEDHTIRATHLKRVGNNPNGETITSPARFVQAVINTACPWCGSLEGYDESEDREPRCIECWGS